MKGSWLFGMDVSDGVFFSSRGMIVVSGEILNLCYRLLLTYDKPFLYGVV